MLKIDNKLITKIHTNQQGKSGQMYEQIIANKWSMEMKESTQCLY